MKRKTSTHHGGIAHHRGNAALRGARARLGLVALSVLLAVAAARGQRVHFDRLSLDEGLSQISAYAVVQDRKGYIRIGTEDGLNRFDGHDVEVLQHDPRDPESLLSSSVRTLDQDPEGRLWVVTQGLALCRFDPGTGRSVRFPADNVSPRGLGDLVWPGFFYVDPAGAVWISLRNQGIRKIRGDELIPLVHDAGDPQSLPGNQARAILEDRAGSVWVGTFDGGLGRLTTAPGREPERFAVYRHDPGDPHSLGTNAVTALYEDRSGDLWVGTWGAGVYRFDRRREIFERLPHPAAAGAEVPGNFIRSRLHSHLPTIVEDGASNLWAVTASGLLRWDPERRHVTHYEHRPGDSTSLGHNVVNAMLVDRAGDLWVGLNAVGGLNRYQASSDGFLRFTPDPTDPSSFPSQSVQTLFEDRSGVLWIGTTHGGVARFSRRKHQFKLYRLPATAPPGLGDNKVFAILEDRDGTLWTGTVEGGVYRYDRDRREVVERYHADPGGRRDLGANWARALLEDDEGALWAGSTGGGLVRIDRDRGVVTGRWINDPDDPRSLSNNIIRDLELDREGDLWIATDFGWNRFDRPSGTFKSYFNDPDDPHSLPSSVTRVTYEDRAGNLWVGCVPGLGRFDRETERFVAYAHDPADPTSIGPDMITALHDDGSGHLWAATFAGGLARLEVATGKFTHYTTRDGLASDALYSLVPDEEGRIWMSSNHGLSRFDPRTETFTNYDRGHGLQANEFSGRSFFKTRSGEILFGGVNGITAFHPRDIRPNALAPPVVLTAFRKADRELDFGRGLDEVDRIVLSYKDRLFSFQFAALDYTYPEKNRYAYLLEGFDDDWVDCGNRREVFFTNLPGGTYTFRVKGSNGDGVWNERGAAIEVVIVPPLWKRWWAYGLYVVAALAAVFAYGRTKSRRHVERMDHQRRTEELERAREIQLSMLPAAPPAVGGLDLAASMKTANEVGGDYYDFFPQDDGSLYIAIGDATGHGLAAGMMVTMTKAVLNALEVDRPDLLLRHLNRVFRAVRLKRMKMALSLLHLRGGEVTLASAAMPPVLLYRAAGGEVRELLASGLPLGSLADLSFRLEVFTLDPGDAMALISDGLPETSDEDGRALGYEAVKRCLAEHGAGDAEGIVRALVELGDGWSGGGPLDDDVAVVVVKRRAIH